MESQWLFHLASVLCIAVVAMVIGLAVVSKLLAERRHQNERSRRRSERWEAFFDKLVMPLFLVTLAGLACIAIAWVIQLFHPLGLS